MTKELHPETIYILAICYYHNILGWQKHVLLGFSGRCYRKILTNFWPTQYVDIFNSFILHIYLYMSASVQFSRSAVSDSFWPHEPQHARPPCPSTTPGVHSNPCPLSQWCYSTILSPVVPFSSCPQSFPASGSFQMSQLFASGSQSIGALASVSVLPKNI